MAVENYMLKVMRDSLGNLKKLQLLLCPKFADMEEYADVILKPRNRYKGKYYFFAKDKDAEMDKYVGNQEKEFVSNVQNAHFLRKRLEFIDHDIELIDSFLKDYKPISFRNIKDNLPGIYVNSNAAEQYDRNNIAARWKEEAEKRKAEHGIFRSEELVQPTVDGNMVRSKSEAMIYNYLFENGFTFVYELPVNGKTRTFFPDFAILSEIDYKTVIFLEHQGMMGNETYRERSETREYEYWSNGYLPGRDVYFTFDDNRGGFDITPIINILAARVRPI